MLLLLGKKQQPVNGIGEIEAEQQSEHFEDHSQTHYRQVVIKSGKKKYLFVRATGPKWNYIAAHDEGSPWGGFGKYFKTWDELQEKYKNPTIKSMALIAESILK